jgi:hypothetical protein
MSRGPRHTVIALAALTALFAARVTGQALVAFLGVSWLPPMAAWYSGLLSYPILLPLQVIILATQLAIDVGVWRGHPKIVGPYPRLGQGIERLSCAYALAMALRALITRTHPIPIVFHWVLAAYLFVVGRFWARQ